MLESFSHTAQFWIMYEKRICKKTEMLGYEKDICMCILNMFKLPFSFDSCSLDV